jgi:hypothetical protein
MHWIDSNGWGMAGIYSIPLLIFFFVHCTLRTFFKNPHWTTIIVINIWFMGGEW